MKKLFFLLALIPLVGFSAEYRYKGNSTKYIPQFKMQVSKNDTFCVDEYYIGTDTMIVFVSDSCGVSWTSQNAAKFDLDTAEVDSFVISNINATKMISIRSNGELKIYPNALTSTVAYELLGVSGTELLTIFPERKIRKLVFQNSGSDSISVSISAYNDEMRY